MDARFTKFILIGELYYLKRTVTLTHLYFAYISKYLK